MNALITIPFYEQSLILIDSDGRPFVAMRPIAQGMGLAWQTQERKLKTRFNSVVTIMVTTGLDGKQYRMLCLPLDKLPTWLMMINPSKVKPEIREAIKRYQAECEKVLWKYWTTGIARRNEIKQELAELEAVEAESFMRGSIAGKDLYIRKLEKQRNQAEIMALQKELPFIWSSIDTKEVA